MNEVHMDIFTSMPIQLCTRRGRIATAQPSSTSTTYNSFNCKFINRNITVLLVSLGWFAEQVEGLQTLPPKQVLNIDPFSQLTNKGSRRFFENRANTSAKFQP